MTIFCWIVIPLTVAFVATLPGGAFQKPVIRVLPQKILNPVTCSVDAPAVELIGAPHASS